LTELVFRDDPYLTRVRLLEIPGVDLQACGGTHVRNTGEIGSVAVARIRSEGRRNKRVTLVLS
jgi:misacylated tRNA(Ala) deacylase